MSDITTTQPQEQQPVRRHFDTDEQAYDSLLARRDEKADEQAKQSTDTQKPVETAPSATEVDFYAQGYRDSAETAELKQLAQAEFTSFAEELLTLAGNLGIPADRAAAAMKAGHVNDVWAAVDQGMNQRIAQTQDKGQAEALRTEWTGTKQRLEQASAVLSQAAAEIRNRETAAQQTRAAQYVERGRAKLAERMPDFDKAATRSYLHDEYGFTEAELSQAYDWRLVELAEKARRHDQGQAKPKRKVPKKKAKQQPQRGNVSEIQTRATRNESEMDRAYRKLQEKRRAKK